MVQEAIQKEAIQTGRVSKIPSGIQEIEQRRQAVVAEKKFLEEKEFAEEKAETKYQQTLSNLDKQEKEILKAIRENKPLPKINVSTVDPYYSAYKQQQDYYKAEYDRIRNTTASGRNINELKQDIDNYNISYYDDGTLRSITAKEQTFIDEYSKKKKNGKKSIDEKRGSYLPYELTFNPDGTIAKEVSRGIYEKEDDYDKRKSGYRRDRDNEVYNKFVAEYQGGKPVVVQKYGVIEGKERKDKDGDKIEQRSVFLSEESRFDKQGNPLSYQKWDTRTEQEKETSKYDKTLRNVWLKEKWDAKSQNLIKFSKEAPEKIIMQEQVVSAPAEVKKLTVTPSDLFGTAKNVLKPGEYEIKVDRSGERYISYEKSTPETIAKLTRLSVSEVKELQKQDPKMLSKVVEDVLEKQLTGKVESQKRFEELTGKQIEALPEVTRQRDIMFAKETGVAVGEELLRKQEEFKKEQERKTITGKVIQYGEKLIAEGERIEREKVKALLKGERPKEGVFIGGEPRIILGTAIRGTGELTQLGKKAIKATPGFVVGKVVPFVEREKKEIFDVFTGAKIGRPGFTTEATAFEKFPIYFEKKLGQTKETTEKLGTGALVVGTALASQGLKFARKDIMETGGAGIRGRIGGELLLGYGIGKGLRGLGRVAGKGVGAIDDIKVAKIATKKGQVVTQKTARQLAGLRGRGIEVQQITGFEKVRVGARKIGGEFVEQETLLLKRAKPTVLDPTDIKPRDFPDVIQLKGKQRFIGTEGFVDDVVPKGAVQQPRKFFVTEKPIDKTIDPLKLKEAIKPSATSISGKDFSIASKVFQTKGGVAVQLQKTGISTPGRPVAFGEVAKGRVRGIKLPWQQKFEEKLLGLRKKPITSKQPQLKTPFGVARVKTPVGEEKILYTFKGVSPVKVASYEITTPKPKSVMGAVMAEGYVRRGGVEIMTKKFAEGRMTTASDIIKTPKDKVVVGAREQVSILKEETIKETPKQKAKVKPEKPRAEKKKTFYDVSRETADRPFFVGDEIPTPARDVFDKGVFRDEVVGRVRKPGVKPIIITERERIVKPPKIKPGVKPSEIKLGVKPFKVELFDKKKAPVRKIEPTIERKSIFEREPTIDIKRDVSFKQYLIYEVKMKILKNKKARFPAITPDIKPPRKILKTDFDAFKTKEPIDDIYKEPIEEEKPIKPRLGFTPTRRNGKGYDVFVKEKGKFVHINKNQPYDYESALAKMGSALEETPSRSGKVKVSQSKKKPKKEPFAKFDASKFYQKASGVWVEKSKHAIDTVGEKQGITVKGWLAREQQSRFSSKPKTIKVPKKKSQSIFSKKKSSIFNQKSKSIFNL